MSTVTNAERQMPARVARAGLLWSLASLGLAVAASIALLFVRFLSSGFSGAGDGGQSYVVAGTRHTLIDSFGLGGVVIILWPILITVLPLVLLNRGNVRRLRALAAVLFLPVLPFGAFVVGGFYLPSAVAMALASWRSEATR